MNIMFGINILAVIGKTFHFNKLDLIVFLASPLASGSHVVKAQLPADSAAAALRKWGPWGNALCTHYTGGSVCQEPGFSNSGSPQCQCHLRGITRLAEKKAHRRGMPLLAVRAWHR